MLICSCAVISDHDVRSAVRWMRKSDPLSVVTPGKVYRALGKSPDCGGCIQHFVAAIQVEMPSDLPAELTGLRHQNEGNAGHEGQRKGHRVSQSRAAQ